MMVRFSKADIREFFWKVYPLRSRHQSRLNIGDVEVAISPDLKLEPHCPFLGEVAIGWGCLEKNG